MQRVDNTEPNTTTKRFPRTSSRPDIPFLLDEPPSLPLAAKVTYIMCIVATLVLVFILAYENGGPLP